MPEPEEGVSPEALAQAMALFAEMEKEAAIDDAISREALRDLLGDLGIELPYSMEEIEDAAVTLRQVQALESAARAFGMGPEFLDPLQKQLELAQATLFERASEKFGPNAGAVNQAISEYITSTVRRQEETAREEVLTRAEYLDIPTPEEFLDQFNVALATHTQQLVESGELDRDTAQWIRDNPDILFDEYIGELGKRAAAGEQIFKPVGLEGEPEALGMRPGRQEARAVGTERESLTDALTQAQQSAQVTKGGVTAPSDTQRTTREQTQLTSSEQLRSTFSETEEIFARPKLNFVYALSPLDFLKERATGTEITYGVEREQGRRIEERRKPVVITPRRVK